MKVPEKIYLSDFTDTTEAVFYVKKDKTKRTDIEYTRTDVVIEKTIKYIANHFLLPGMDNEINDFVNYMKGE